MSVVLPCSEEMDYNEAMEMLRVLFGWRVARVSFSDTPLYGYAMFLEGFKASFYGDSARAFGLYLIHDYEGEPYCGMTTPVSLWAREDAKKFPDGLFGVNADDPDVEPLSLFAEGREWEETREGLELDFCEDFVAALNGE